MNRLTTFSKVLIVLAILAAIYFGVTYFFSEQLGLPKLGSDAVKTENVESNGADAAANANGTAGTSGAAAGAGTATSNNTASAGAASTNTGKSFAFKPQAPIGGQLMGVVELGASGFNSFIIKKDSDDNWEKVKYEWGNSLVVDGMASDADITKGLKTYIGNILDFGVSGKHIHFVVSSGAKKEPVMLPIISNLKKMGYVVNEVTPEQEGQYALKSVLPKSYEGNAFVVDIGSGNTKVSWISGNKVIAKEGPGAKYFKKGIADAQAYNEVKTISSEVPANLAKTCFIIGGVPFNLAKASRNGEERYTVLAAPNAYTKLAEEKGKKVQSGLNLYQGIIDGSGCQEFIFDWNANFTIGFLLALPG